MIRSTRLERAHGGPPVRRHVLVTGGAGFIGAVVCRHLVDAGLRVTAVDNGDEPRHLRSRRALPDVVWCGADLLGDGLDLVDLLHGVDSVVHLAGRPGVQTSWGGGFEDHLRRNTLLTQRLLEAAMVTSLSRVVVASSSSVYGDIPDGLAAEHRPPRPLSPYGVSKLAVESLVQAYAERGVPAVALRLFTVYGRGQRPDMALHRIIDAALGAQPFPLRGSGLQARDFTHVDDVARAVAAALDVPIAPGTVCNVGGGRPVAVVDLIGEVEAQLGLAVPVLRVGEAGGDPARTAADPTLARALLGWSAEVPLSAGVADQIAAHVTAHIAASSSPSSTRAVGPLISAP